MQLTDILLQSYFLRISFAFGLDPGSCLPRCVNASSFDDDRVSEVQFIVSGQHYLIVRNHLIWGYFFYNKLLVFRCLQRYPSSFSSVQDYVTDCVYFDKL